MNRCVISLATRDRRYEESLRRLERNLRAHGYRDAFRPWIGEWPPGCPSQDEAPYAFKPFCFREAQRQGAGLVLWMDSSCVALRSVDPLFDAVRRDGILLFRNRDAFLGQWASDESLEAHRLSREEAIRLPEVSACVVGLDLRHPRGREFLDRWLGHATDGFSFRGTRAKTKTRTEFLAMRWNRGGRASRDPRVRGHRYEQTCAGILASRMGLTLREHGIAHDVRHVFRKDSIIFILRDVPGGPFLEGVRSPLAIFLAAGCRKLRRMPWEFAAAAGLRSGGRNGMAEG